MRPILYIAALSLTICALAYSCTWHNIINNSALLQHKWEITSLNGEALRYVGKPGDYFDFENGRLIEYFGGQYDTLDYAVTNNGSTLELRTVINGVVNTTPLDLRIDSLTANQLILTQSSPAPNFPIADSLYR